MINSDKSTTLSQYLQLMQTEPNRAYIADQDNRSALALQINDQVSLCHGLSAEAGWWTQNGKGSDGTLFSLDLVQIVRFPSGGYEQLLSNALVAQKLCLVHSEVSEGMEGVRKGLMDDKLPHRSMLEVELADAVIHIYDLAGALNLDLGGAIAEKLSFNAIREDHKPENREKEGGKTF